MRLKTRSKSGALFIGITTLLILGLNFNGCTSNEATPTIPVEPPAPEITPDFKPVPSPPEPEPIPKLSPPTPESAEQPVTLPDPPSTPESSIPPILQVGGTGQYHTMQEAIDAARHGDTIRIARGTYLENLKIGGLTDITIQGGWNSAFSTRNDDNTLTVIDGGGNDHVITVDTGTSTNIKLKLDGITIRNGWSERGAGICVSSYGKNSNVDLTLTNSTISENTAEVRGGGIYAAAWDSGSINLLLVNNTITQNYSGDNGGGIDIDSTQASVEASITNNTIIGNKARDIGGGLHINTMAGGIADISVSGNTIKGNIGENIDAGGIGIYASGNGKTVVSLTNNLIMDNQASFGGGILGYAWGERGVARITLNNNIITGNRAKFGAGIFSCSGKTGPDVSEPGGSITWILTNNTITGNIASECVGGILLFSGSDFGDGGVMNLLSHNDIIWGNTDTCGDQQISLKVAEGKAGAATANIAYSAIGLIEPRIEGIYTLDYVINKDPLFINAARGDFRLQDSSPCIDSGDPDMSYNDEKRPPAKGTERNDMGAYGGPANYDWPDATE